MISIAIANQKGGVGKTITALNVSCGLAQKGHKVLVIDGDPQAILTSIFIKEAVRNSLYSVLKDEASIDDCVVEVKESLFLLPADPRLARIDLEIGGLKDRLKHVKTYDYVIIDSLPSLGDLAREYLVFAHYVLIPIKTDYLTLRGTAKILDLVSIVQEEHNPRLKVLGYLPCQYDSRRVLDRDVLGVLQKRFSKDVFKPIRQNIALAVSPSWGQSIWEYQRSSNGAKDYDRLIREILKRTGEGKHA